jgi:predicted ribosomally synthesized peptide with SipW-like signal peptide
MRRINRVVALGGLAVVGLGAGAFVSSTAFFTDTETVATNSFTTATLDLAASPASAVVSSSNLQPGDEINGTLTISNSGSVTLRYAMTTSATDPDGKALRDLMTLVIKTSGTSCAAFDGTTLYSGVIASAALGNPGVGQQTGDRQLAAAASEQLCFRAAMPTSATNAYQQAATTATFTFAAEQTAHNP